MGDGQNGSPGLSVLRLHCALNNELQERDGGAWAGFEAKPRAEPLAHHKAQFEREQKQPVLSLIGLRASQFSVAPSLPQVKNSAL